MPVNFAQIDRSFEAPDDTIFCQPEYLSTLVDQPFVTIPQSGVVVVDPVTGHWAKRSSSYSFGGQAITLREVAIKEAAGVVSKALDRAFLRPDRVSITSDGSALFQFLCENTVGVDVYPSGEVVVLIRDGGVTHVHELDLRDIKRIIDLVRHARAER